MSRLDRAWLALLAVAAISSAPAVDLVDGLGGAAGFGENVMAVNDDQYTQVDLTSVFPTGLRYYGRRFTTAWLNNNGNLTFGAGSSTFTPGYITAGNTLPIIAAWYADVDTRGTDYLTSPGGKSRGTNRVYWDFDTANGIVTFTWDDVGYYSSHTDKVNAFQIRLSRLGTAGDFEIEFRYEALNWTTGDASSGVDGLGGTVVRAGFSAGDGAHYYELPESGNQAAMLGLATALGNTGTAGLWRWRVEQPTVTVSTPYAISRTSPILFNFSVTTNGTGFASDDISITGGSPGLLTGPVANGSTNLYAMNVVPSGDGAVVVSVREGAIATQFLDPSPAASAAAIYDHTAPLIVGLADSSPSSSPIQLAPTITDSASGLASISWSQTGGPAARFGSPTSATTAVTLPQDAIYQFQVVATDRAGNSGIASATVNYDALPIVSAGADQAKRAVFMPGASARDSAFLSGLSVAWTVVSAPVGGTVSFSSTAAINPTISCNLDGTYVLRLTATEAGGRVASDEVSVIWDTTAPTAPSAPEVTTDRPTPFWGVSGSVEANATVTLFIDGVQRAAVTAAADGTWSWTDPLGVFAGAHQAHIVVTDAAGNASAASPSTAFTMPEGATANTGSGGGCGGGIGLAGLVAAIGLALMPRRRRR